MSSAERPAGERADLEQRFSDAVNMTASELTRWLETEESQSVGVGEGESVGHRSGRRTVEVLHGRKSERDEDDLDHMQQVVGYVARHGAQRPAGDVTDTRWRWSLMNWGHDPLKD